jgi:hypothetical protein
METPSPTPVPVTTHNTHTHHHRPVNGKHDVVTHRILVSSLAACVLFSAVGSAILAALERPVPHSMSALGYTALGALTGMLASIMKGGHSS